MDRRIDPGVEGPSSRGDSEERCPPAEPLEAEEPELEDEPAGAVLLEMLPRPALVYWGGVDLACVAALGALALSVELPRLGAARLPLGLLWISLPISSILGLLVTIFTRLNLPADTGPNRVARWAFGLQLAALGAWAFLSWGVRVAF